MENFTPWSALAGGALLGLSATLLLLFSGKIAGISGIIGGLLKPQKGEFSWRLAFVLGMFGSAFILAPWPIELPELTGQPSITIVIAGLLVGFGTRLGNGCTSGHGIVGIGRFSKRSLVATCIFMLVAALLVLIRQQFGGL